MEEFGRYFNVPNPGRRPSRALVETFDPLGRDLDALLAAETALSTDDGIVRTESLFTLEAWKGSLRPSSIGT